MAVRTILLRKKLADKQAEEAKLRSKLSSFKTREDELAQAIEDAETEEEMSAVEDAVEELETNQADVKESLKKVANEIADIISQIEESEAAQADALDGDDTDGEGSEDTDNDDDGQRSRRRGGKRSVMPVRMELRAAQEFQRTGRHTYKDVRSFIRGALVTGDTARPTTVGGINEPIGGMSSLIDMIKVTDCTGVGTYRVAMVTEETAAAAEFTEGTAPAEALPKFDYVDLTPTNYGTLAYISKEIRKQTPLEYEAKVNEYARRSLRKKLNSVTAAAALESKLNTSLQLTGASGAALITPTLISEIILSYGGDEGIEGSACLYLHKEDLKALAAVRGKNEYLPVYTIIPDTDNPSTGVIKDNYGLSTRYCLTKDVTALSTAILSAKATKHMFYGNPQCLEMGLWGGFDVDVNDGYKFAEGLLTIRGEVTADVDVTVKNGFVVVEAANA